MIVLLQGAVRGLPDYWALATVISIVGQLSRVSTSTGMIFIMLTEQVASREAWPQAKGYDSFSSPVSRSLSCVHIPPFR